MTTPGRMATLIRHRRGTVALEFAIVANALILLLVGAIGTGLLWWTANGLQTAAALTARYAALHITLSPANWQSFAVTAAGDWTFAGIITPNDVTSVTGPSCNTSGSPGQFVTITITAPFWASVPLPGPLSNISLSASSCFPAPS